MAKKSRRPARRSKPAPAKARVPLPERRAAERTPKHDESTDNAPDALGVTPKQRRFVHEYLFDLNGTQAAIRAGYSAKTAASQAYDLLRKPEIAALVAYEQRAQLERAQISAENLKRVLWKAAVPDLARLKDSHGRWRPLHELSPDDRALITAVEVVKRNVYSDDGVVDDVLKVTLRNPDTAALILAKHLGLAKDAVEHTGSFRLRWATDDDDEED